MNELTNYNENTFESIKHINEYGQEYWKARELYKILEYTEYRKFLPVIEKAIKSCENSNISSLEHFAQVSDRLEVHNIHCTNNRNFRLC